MTQHFGLIAEVKLNKVKYLLQKYPAGCKIKDNHGNLPLHLFVFAAFSNNYDCIKHINLLLDIYEEAAVLKKDSHSNCPVNTAVYHEFYDKAVCLICKYPFVDPIKEEDMALLLFAALETFKESDVFSEAVD